MHRTYHSPFGLTRYYNMEAQLVAEFVSRTGASSNDALSCLNSWGWDLKKALIDYNGNGLTKPLPPICGQSLIIFFVSKIDTSTTNYFKGQTVQVPPTLELLRPVKPLRQQSLSKTDSIDVVDCEYPL